MRIQVKTATLHGYGHTPDLGQFGPVLTLGEIGKKAVKNMTMTDDLFFIEFGNGTQVIMPMTSVFSAIPKEPVKLDG